MKRVAIITSSDTGYRGEREDLSGPAIREIVEKNGYEVVSEDVLPDDRKMLSERMAEIADSGTAELILTTGGTGFSPRDITPEATEDIIDRRVPGIPEAMRAYSMTITKRAMLFSVPDDLLDHRSSNPLDRRKSVTDITVIYRKITNPTIDIRRQDRNSHLSASVNVFGNLSRIVDDRSHKRCHIFYRIIIFQIRCLV